jgi:hypothetical protein
MRASSLSAGSQSQCATCSKCASRHRDSLSVVSARHELLPRREREAAEDTSERERPRAAFETRPVRYPAGGESKTKISKARSGSKTIWLW